MFLKSQKVLFMTYVFYNKLFYDSQFYVRVNILIQKVNNWLNKAQTLQQKCEVKLKLRFYD